MAKGLLLCQFLLLTHWAAGRDQLRRDPVNMQLMFWLQGARVFLRCGWRGQHADSMQNPMHGLDASLLRYVDVRSFLSRAVFTMY